MQSKIDNKKYDINKIKGNVSEQVGILQKHIDRQQWVGALWFLFIRRFYY